MENWTQLLEQAGMDQKDLATALDKSPSVISALVNNVTGKAAAGKKLKRQALDYLNARLATSESVVDGRQKSEVSTLEFRDEGGEYKTATEWKTEAIRLREENARLRAAIQLLADTGVPLSSAASEKAHQLAREILRRSKSGSQPGANQSDAKAG